MQFLTMLAIVALLVVPDFSEADEMYLGLRTYHFDRGGRDCINETHDLVAYSKHGYYGGTYVNSQCRRSYLVGTSHKIKGGFGYDVSIVTGYPSSMHLVEGVVLIPTVTYKYYVDSIGVKIIYVPTVLVGIGMAIII